jgi:hypothetical protein
MMTGWEESTDIDENINTNNWGKLVPKNLTEKSNLSKSDYLVRRSTRPTFRRTYFTTFIILANMTVYNQRLEEFNNFKCIQYGRELMDKQLKKNYDLYHCPPQFTPFKILTKGTNLNITLIESPVKNHYYIKASDKITHPLVSFNNIKVNNNYLHKSPEIKKSEIIIQECTSSFKVLNNSVDDFGDVIEEWAMSECINTPQSVTSLATSNKKTPQDILQSRANIYYATNKHVNNAKQTSNRRRHSDKENISAIIRGNTNELNTSVKQNSTWMVNGICTDGKSSYMGMPSVNNSKKKRLTAKGIASPESQNNHLYNNNSSKDTIVVLPDNYWHPNHGEPMDLDSQYSDEPESLNPKLGLLVWYCS